VIRWRELDRARSPGGRDEITLHQRGDGLSIRIGGKELMNSRRHGSEAALAVLACERVRHRAGARVLVGGLGMGYTLAAALEVCGRDARVVVLELFPAVVSWNHGVVGELAGHPLRDARVDVRVGDVAEVVRAGEPFDAILLDVDNGPDGLTQQSNDWLYGAAGLAAARRALRDKGVLAVWSAAPDPAFVRRLARAGFEVETHRVRARPGAGDRHVIYLGLAR
jgi:spermidine synthase